MEERSVTACGTVIDRYEIGELLAAGGFGAVYRGRHVHTRRAVAIKLLDPRLAADAAAVVRFKREAQALSAIACPHVVEVLDWGVRASRDADAPQAYLVMELLEGRDLRTTLRDGPLPIGRALAIARQLLDALRSVHAAGIVHRDLKPSNVVLVGSDHVKLIDFGISRLPAIANDPFRTATGTVFGSPGYAAPEQLRGGEVDARADVYAAGAVVYHMLAGSLPHAFAGYEDYVVRACTEDPQPITEHVEVPAQVARAVMRALDRDPARRYASAADFADALGEPPTIRERPARAVKSRAWRLPVVGVIAALAAGIGWWAMREPAADSPSAMHRDAGDATLTHATTDATNATIHTPIDAAIDAPVIATTDAGPSIDPRIAWLDARLRRLDCVRPQECPLLSCGCRHGGRELGSTCASNTCASVAGTCAAACERFGGWAGTVTEGVLGGNARSDRDCAISTLCASEGRCRERAGECVVAHCSETVACKRLGLCADDGDACAPDDEGCAKSSDCRDRGRCRRGGNRCAARSDADCRAAVACRVDGECGMVGAECVVTSADDCARSDRCRSLGRCRWEPGYSSCFK